MNKLVLLFILVGMPNVFSQNNVPPSGSVNFDTNLKIGKQEAPANTAGEIIRLSLRPYGHTGGLWDFTARDIAGAAYLDINYGLNSVITFGTDKNVGIGTITPLAKLEVKGGNILVRNSSNVDNESSIMIAHSIALGSYNTFGTSIRTITQISGYNTYGMQFFTQELHSTGQTEKMRILGNGNVGIGTITTGTHKLAVEGSIGAREVKVQATGWADFVFKKEYNLPTLQEVEKHITEKGHLENIPSEEDVLKNGINLGEMNAKLLQKIEELTLYVIDQNKKIEELIKETKILKEDNKSFKTILESDFGAKN
ncbi:hypothetical protein [Flavobacterium sp. ov086]|uniref:hypothetical protein n=1 Tax=Flavobacterium sp. ov086 TaxID=1761785 RepID=UPI000B6AE2A2|nr:hypothetical protein [Flavobacterium sp. ov086]SNR79662.1 hypothetical protein SAMN04487979_1228 [Flavobacterium sp. ov086]